MNAAEVHKHFSCECFNQTWVLLDLPERSSEQERKMLALSHASLFHWLSREDCRPLNLSVGLWQLARVYAVLDSPLEAMRFARDCLEVSEPASLAPFFMAYAHEAVCRAAMMGGDRALAESHWEISRRFADAVTDSKDKGLIDSDLDNLQKRIRESRDS